ncbi:MAG TPA: ATP synthase F1 subunit delta [Gemmatimonadales bacterium]|nr:ATP synthase F1 subunit delta [Gemmatimonadales bacterium]
MKSVAIARNYAEALFALGEQANQLEEFAGLMDTVAAAVSTSPEVEAVLMSPNVPKGQKARLVGAALAGAPKPFVLFVQTVVRKGRQAFLADIAREYGALVDTKFNRVRASVIVAREPSEGLRTLIRERLSQAFSKQVLETYVVTPSILGGAIVKVGDKVYDGSVRRRLARLRRQLLAR